MKSLFTFLFLAFTTTAFAQKLDTIRFQDGYYLLKSGDSIRTTDQLTVISDEWHKTFKSRASIVRTLYHNWPILIGLKREYLVKIIGQPDMLLPDRYIFETDFVFGGIYVGCWLGFGYTDGKISYVGIQCAN